MAIWRRWFGRLGQSGTVDPNEQRMQTIRHEASQLKSEIRQLCQQRQAIEQRGCFSDRELEAKDRELEQLDNRIKAVKDQHFRLRTFGRVDH
jgi:chromosome segregation ATPase